MSTVAISSPACRRLPAIGNARLGTWVLPAFVAAVGAVVSLRPALDPDLGWHLRAGEAILASHQASHADAFSYTMAGKPWADFEWLWEAAATALHSTFGNVGLVAAGSGVTAIAVLLVYVYLRERRLTPLFAGLGAMAALLNLMPYAAVRPGMMGPLFLGLDLAIMERVRRGGRLQWLLALLPAQVLWANVHGSYIQAVLLCACYGVGLAWERRRWQAAGPWAALAAVLLTVSLANPLGTGLLRFTLGASGMRWNHNHNGEWLAPNFHSAGAWPLLATLLLTVAMVAARGRVAIGKPEALLLLGGTLAALQSNQFVPFYAVAAAPVTAQLVQGLIQRQVTLNPRLTHGLGFLAVLGLLLAGAVRGLQPAAYEAAVATEYPAGAVAFIQQRGLAGPMFNDFDWGSYLIGTMPWLPVFVDGRTEMYGDAFLNRYLRTANGLIDPEPVLDQYGVRLVLIKPDSALATTLRRDRAWSETYHDDVASVFVPVGSAG